MLILERETDQGVTIKVGDQLIRLVVLRSGRRCKLGFSADPDKVDIVKNELLLDSPTNVVELPATEANKSPQ